MEDKYVMLLFLVALFYSVSGDDGEALLRLKSTIVDPMGHLADWGRGSSHYCEWTGISCNTDGRATALDISAMNLTGTITDDINRLTELTSLNVCCNSFATTLPRSLHNLTKLVHIDVSHNAFIGAFPQGLSSAGGLLNATAYSNNFTGTLPVDLPGGLQYLDLRGSFFEGEFPKSYGKFVNLRFLGISGNNLTGRLPAEIGEMKELEFGFLGYNRFTGTVPGEIGNLVNLQYLDLSNAEFEGLIPKEIGNLSKLHTLFMYRNQLSGSVPAELGNCSALMSLDLSDNFLSGEIPSEISKLRSLRLLSLMFNSLSGPIPGGLGDLPELRTVELWNNSLTGRLPQQLGRHSVLEWLDVSSNRLSGPIPPDLCRGSNLTKLILFNNCFSAPIPRSLAGCRSLWRVRIHNNKLSGALPVGFGGLQNLTRLEISHNRLSGPVPADLAAATRLSFVDLSFNSLNGTLPENIFAMPSLQRFYISDNLLSGSMPDVFGQCSFLSVVNLSMNYLRGPIPGAEIKKCEKLVALDLRKNRFAGAIPSELAAMPALAVLDLSLNNLTGNIPQKFGSSAVLEIFNVSYNRLSGSVPYDGIFKTVTVDSFQGNRGLCGGVLGPCDLSYVRRQNTQRRRETWVFALVAVIAIAAALVGAQWVIRRRMLISVCGNSFHEDSKDWPWRMTAFQRLEFNCSDILNCIKDSNIIGMGGTGTVYKAEFSKVSAAVKKLWKTQAELNDDTASPPFIAEVDLLGHLRHRNILRLMGYCYNDVHTLLLYEYMPNGSLADALHGKAACQNLLADWVTRYNIAVGIAQGLCYLHHDCSPLVVHRDVKSNNILLDVNMDARVADFGLAKLIKANESMSMVAGSYGYIAPEYAYTLKVDEKSDIYSYGVVLMELLTGRRPVEAEFGEAMNIVEWMREKIKTRQGIEQALDSNVGGMCAHVQEEMVMVARIALLCTSQFPKDRPTMRDVVTMLAEAKPRRKSNAVSANASAGGSFTNYKDHISQALNNENSDSNVGRLSLTLPTSLSTSACASPPRSSVELTRRP